MRKGCEAADRAEHYERKAEAVDANRSISSDDPDAPEKLRAKLAEMEASHARMIATNRAYRAGNLETLGFTPEQVAALHERITGAYSWERQPYPAYALTNSNKEIRRLKERIEQLEKRAVEVATAPQTERVVGAVRIVDNAEANRVQVFFPGKPDAEMRGRLKAAGFRWAPSEGAWQAYRNIRTEWQLGNLFPELKAETGLAL